MRLVPKAPVFFLSQFGIKNGGALFVHEKVLGAKLVVLLNAGEEFLDRRGALSSQINELVEFPTGLKLELVGVPEHEGHHGIPNLLVGHTAQNRSREIIGLGFRRFGATGEAVVSLGIDDDPGKGLEIEVQHEHFLREDLEEFWIVGFARIDVVKGFGNSAAHVFSPHPVGDIHREALVVARG